MQWVALLSAAPNASDTATDVIVVALIGAAFLLRNRDR
jgi:hypothetical protein